jgi:vesicle-fusing ATPase
MQRQWIGLSLSGDGVTIDLFPQEPPYLQSIDVQVGFVRKGVENQVPYSADEISSNFIKTFNNVVFAPGEILTFDFKGEKLKMTVVSMSLIELPDKQNRARSGRQTQMEMGIVMSGTDVNIMKAADSMIKIKSTSKRRVL